MLRAGWSPFAFKKACMSQFPKQPPAGEGAAFSSPSSSPLEQLSFPFSENFQGLYAPSALDPEERGQTILFIDGVNLFHAASVLKIEIDYAKLRRLFNLKNQLIQAFFYTGVDPRNEKQKGFLLWMRSHGYRVVTKELPITPDGVQRVSMNVEIAIDMVTLAAHCQTEILISSDCDLGYAVEVVTQANVRVEVVALPAMMTSDRLKSAATRYTDLALLRDHIQKQPRR
jgi:uncharacterized LabA/DUF88 family protein